MNTTARRNHITDLETWTIGFAARMMLILGISVFMLVLLLVTVIGHGSATSIFG